MKSSSRVVFLAILLAAAIAAGAARAAGSVQTILERDWERQLQLRFTPAPTQAAITPASDAAGAVDGVIDGKYGFHTSQEDNPWWQVDLEAPAAIHRIVVYNRCDKVAPRIARLQVLLSADGRAWKSIYTHDGSTFYGFTDKKPLAIDAAGRAARYVRLQLPGRTFLHLDEVQVLNAQDVNLALGKPALQSSCSNWSASHQKPAALGAGDIAAAARLTLRRGASLAADLKATGVDTAPYAREAAALAARLEGLAPGASVEQAKPLYFATRAAVRRLALQNPLLNFDRLLVNKQIPGSFTHMSDQYLGWWSRPGGGISILEGIKSGQPKETCLTSSFPASGSFLRPMLSWDGKRVLFAWCRHYPEIAAVANKLDKAALPEDSFYHLYEMNIDGSGVRQLTHGKYNDMDGRYLPDGRIVFLSTRRGWSVQYGPEQSLRTMREAELPEAYVRCGGGPERPCAVYTLHTMNPDGSRITAISPFEMFEWTPTVAADGTIVYARWDYIDRFNMPYMKLWRTNPDGSSPSHVFGNYIPAPHTAFEPRQIPGSAKFIFTAGAHHSITGGSLVVLDPNKDREGASAMTRITPEVPFPESESGRATVPHYYCSPWPLSEKYFLVAWSHQPLVIWPTPGSNTENGMGVYLYDVHGNLELLYRDEAINTLHPIPLRPMERPPVLQSPLPESAPPQGRFLLSNVYASQKPLPPDVRVASLRILAVPPKTQPTMNSPSIGLTRDDPGKVVLGTVPVEADGSAFFEAPACVTLFFQALDKDGVAIQTMRSATYLQPGQTLACVGCHEPRSGAPRPPASPLAARRAPSKIAPGPQGSWPLRFDRLVLPVVQSKCIACHSGPKAFPNDAAKAYAKLTQAGQPSLKELVLKQYREPYSIPGQCIASASPLLKHLRKHLAQGRIDAQDFERLVTWLDSYAQFAGQFNASQEQELEALKQSWTRLGILQPAARSVAQAGSPPRE